LLWVGVTLAFVSASVLWLLTRWQPVTSTSGVQAANRLPVFFNPAPPNIRDRSVELVQAIAQGGATAESAAQEAAALGGAALPHI
jgi:hypothetical protein